jgi:DNA-binding ferritin-like protein (Dps family)
MAASWIEKVTGSLDQKKRYRQYKARLEELPPNYRAAAKAFDRYFMQFGGVADGEIALKMLSDLADLFEQSAAGRTPIRSIVGDDPVEFAETFLKNYSDGQWINKERAKLTAAIDKAAGEEQ